MRKFLAAFVLALAATVSSADEVQAVIDEAIRHHGGALYESSEVSLSISSLSGTFALTSRVDGGLFDHRVERGEGAEAHLVRVTNDGVSVIRDGEESLVTGEDAERLQRFVFARVYFPFLPYRLNDPGVRKADQGLESWDGRQLRRVKVTFDSGDGDEYAFWFDPATGRLEQLAYSFQTGKGGLRFRRAFNHRRVGGILFHDAENFGMSGKGLNVDYVTPEAVGSMDHISTIELRDIRVAPPAAR